MKKLLTIMLLMVSFVLIGCNSSHIVTENTIPVKESSVKRDVVYRLDTVIIRDSVDRYIAGDTVYVTKSKQIIKYSVSRDTIIRVDSIPVVVTKTVVQTVEVEKTSGWKNFLMWLGVIFIVYILLRTFVFKS